MGFWIIANLNLVIMVTWPNYINCPQLVVGLIIASAIIKHKTSSLLLILVTYHLVLYFQSFQIILLRSQSSSAGVLVVVVVVQSVGASEWLLLVCTKVTTRPGRAALAGPRAGPRHTRPVAPPPPAGKPFTLVSHVTAAPVQYARWHQWQRLSS